MNIYILSTQITDLPKQDSDCPVNLIDLNEPNSYDKIGLSNEACIIFYQNPTAILTSLLQVGMASKQAIKESEAQVNFLVKTFKNSRSKVRLISMDNAEMISGMPELKECSQLISYLKKTENSLHDIAAKLMVMQNRSLVKLSQQLEACSEVPFQDVEVDIDEVLNNERLKKEHYATELAQIQKNLQKEQQSKINLEIELKATQLDKTQLEQGLAQEKKSSKEQLQKLTENLKQVEEENELIIKQLHHLQESLEASLQKVEAQNKTKIQLEQELAHSQNELIKEQQATSQKQAELQSVQNQLLKEQGTAKEQTQKLSKNLKQVEEENGLIIQQLHSTQESLEASLDKVEAQNKTKIQLEQDLAHSQHALKQEQQLTKQKTAELQSINDELGQLKKYSKEQRGSLTRELEQAEVENELIIQQLHNVQEELEYQLISKADLAKQHSVLTSNKRDSETYSHWLQGLHHKVVNEYYKTNRRYRNIIKKQIQLITKSNLFDEQWYLDTYPDLKDSGIEPALHYLLYGIAEGRNPSAGFNTMNYIFTYTDVAESGLNPLVHFVKFGQAENRESDPRRKCLPAPKNNQ